MTPFEMGWFTAGSGEIWNCDQTYCLVDYPALPKIDNSLLQGVFQWLTPLEKGEEGMNHEEIATNLEQQLLNDLTQLLVHCSEARLNLPESFIHFFQQPGLYNNIPSCTACYFELSNGLLACPNDDKGKLIRFLNDQQSLLIWYLYLQPDNGAKVLVASPEWNDDSEADFQSLDDAIILRDMLLCGNSFEEFVYRFWIENKIWFALTEGRPLNKLQQDYLLAAHTQDNAVRSGISIS